MVGLVTCKNEDVIKFFLKALDHMASEKKIVLRFPILSPREMMTRGMANLDSRGMIGRIYLGYHLLLLHTKYTRFMPCGFREEDCFYCFSHYKRMADNYAPGAWPIWTPGSRLAAIIKGLTKSNRKAMNRNWSNQKANPALKTKAGNK